MNLNDLANDLEFKIKLKHWISLDCKRTFKGFPINQNQLCQKRPNFSDNSSHYQIEIKLLENSKALKSLFFLITCIFICQKTLILNFDLFFLARRKAQRAVRRLLPT